MPLKLISMRGQIKAQDSNVSTTSRIYLGATQPIDTFLLMLSNICKCLSLFTLSLLALHTSCNLAVVLKQNNIILLEFEI